MSEWPKVALGNLAAPQDGAIAIGPFGSAMKAETYTPFGVPVIRGTNISSSRAWKGDWVFVSDIFVDSMPRCIVKSGELVFPHRGAIGAVAIVPEDTYVRYFLSTSLMKIKIDETKADPFFVYYFFRSRSGQDEILKYTSQVGTPGIGQPLSSLKSFKLPLPPLTVQKSIASTLTALDDKIDLHRRMNETLEAMARMIFRDWFIDFGPARAKMEGRPPYLASEIWSLFPDRLDDEGMPEGWHTGSLNEHASLNPESWSSANYPALINYVDLSGAKWGTIDTIVPHNSEHAPSRAQRVLRPGDTIIGTVRPANGSYALVSEVGLTGSSGFAVLRPRRNGTREFVYLAASSQSNIDRLAHLADGAAYPAVSPEVVGATEAAIVGDPLMRAFSAVAGALIDRMEMNKQESKALAATRDFLLPKLMSGEIRVKEAEKIAEAAA